MVSVDLLVAQRLGGRLHPDRSRALQHRRGDRVLRHHQDLLVVPHHGQHTCAASSSQQLPVEDVVEPHLQFPGEERPDDGSHRVLVARGSAFVLQTAVQDGGGGAGRVRTSAYVLQPAFGGRGDVYVTMITCYLSCYPRV